MAKQKEKGSSGIGGQAVLEGVMMKNQDHYAVAVRRPDGEIEIETDEFQGVLHGNILKKTPFIRGIFNFIDSMMLGISTLNYSASFYEDEEQKESVSDKILNKIFKGYAEKVLMGLVTVISIVFAVAIFMVLPYFLSDLLTKQIRNASLVAIIEGVIRIAIFIIYVVLISLSKDIKRVFMYHGAEHKCINCVEKGRPLTVKNVMKCSRQHKRCGTSFMLFVMMVSVVLFFFIRTDSTLLKVVYRIVLIPVIAGISYEILRLAGRSDNIIIRALSAPGMLLQKLTTKEPDEDMVEVAIASVEAVFDWKTYYKENFGYVVDEEFLKEDDSAYAEDSNGEDFTDETAENSDTKDKVQSEDQK